MASYTTFVQKNPLRNYWPAETYFECKETASNKPNSIVEIPNDIYVLQKCLTLCNEKGLAQCVNAYTFFDYEDGDIKCSFQGEECEVIWGYVYSSAPETYYFIGCCLLTQ